MRRVTGDACDATSCSSPARAQVENKQGDASHASPTRLSSGDVAGLPRRHPRPPRHLCTRCGTPEASCDATQLYRGAGCCDTCRHATEESES